MSIPKWPASLAVFFWVASFLLSIHSPAYANGPPESYSRYETDPFEVYSYDNIQAMADAIRSEGHPIPRGHPRIFIKNYVDENGNRISNIESLRQKIISSPELMKIMQEAVDFAHQYYGVTINDNIPDYSRETKTQPAILANGIIYQMGEIPGINYYNRTPHDYGRDGVRHLMSTLNLTGGWDAHPTPGGYYHYVPYYGPPLGYDWFYDLVDEPQRNTMGRLLLDMAQPDDGRVAGTHLGGKLTGPIAVYGDGVDDAEAQRLLNLFHNGLVFGDTKNIKFNSWQWLFNNLTTDHIFTPEGPGNQGLAYSWEYPTIQHFLEVWFDQTGENYFKLPFLQNLVYQAFYAVGNDYDFDAWDRYHQFTHLREAEPNPRRHPYHAPMLISAIALSRTNPIAAKLASSEIHWPSLGLTEKIIYLLRSDPAITPKTPTELNLPTTAHFRGINRILARDSWEGTDTAWLWFQCPTWTNIRNGGPANEIMIRKNKGTLLGKHGGQGHDYEGGNRTSTIVLYDETQPEATFAPKNVMDNAYAYGLGIRLDSGASLTELSKNVAGYNEGLRYFEEKPGEYLYAMGDGGKDFQMIKKGIPTVDPRNPWSLISATNLDYWSRQIIWFRSEGGQLDHFMMLDRLKAPNAGVSAHIPLHFAAKPAIRDKENNQDLGEGNVESASDRFIRVSIGGVIYHSAVDYEKGITIEFKDPGAPNNPLSVSVSGKAVTVSLGTDASGNVTSTTTSVANLINGNPQATSLIRAYGPAWTYSNDPVTPTNGPVPLAGGKGILRYEGADRIVATNNFPTKWGQAHGRLFIDTLFPKSPVYYRVGGVETRNIDLFGHLNYSYFSLYGSEEDPENITKGLYKVQIASPSQEQEQLFLNVMQATDASVETPNATTLLESPNLVGAAVANNIALFNREEAVLTTGSVVVPAGVSGTCRLLLADLKPYGTYDLTIAGNKSQQTTSKTGTLYLGSIPIAPGDTITLSLIGSALTCGDANGDGIANPQDIVTMVQMLVGKSSTPPNICHLDLNKDGAFSVADVVLGIRHIVNGTIPTCNCGET